MADTRSVIFLRQWGVYFPPEEATFPAAEAAQLVASGWARYEDAESAPASEPDASPEDVPPPPEDASGDTPEAKPARAGKTDAPETEGATPNDG